MILMRLCRICCQQRILPLEGRFAQIGDMFCKGPSMRHSCGDRWGSMVRIARTHSPHCNKWQETGRFVGMQEAVLSSLYSHSVRGLLGLVRTVGRYSNAWHRRCSARAQGCASVYLANMYTSACMHICIAYAHELKHAHM